MAAIGAGSKANIGNDSDVVAAAGIAPASRSLSGPAALNPENVSGVAV